MFSSKPFQIIYSSDEGYDEQFAILEPTNYMKEMQKYTDNDKSKKDYEFNTTSWVLCETDFDEGDKVYILPCLHFMHRGDCYRFTVCETGLCPCGINALNLIENQ